MKTRFAAAAILGMVVVFVLAVAGTLIAKSRIPQTETAGAVASSADLRFQATKNLEIRKNVVLTSSDGVRLETNVLRWQGAEKRLWTDEPVRISRGGAVADGSSLEVRMGEEYTILGGRVRAVFSEGNQ